MMSTLDFGYTKIDVCVNNCMLYFQENIDRILCTIYGYPRYKPIQLFMGRQKKRPFKVLRYLSLILRLQILFMSSKITLHMVWHASNQHVDSSMVHLVDSEA